MQIETLEGNIKEELMNIEISSFVEGFPQSLRDSIKSLYTDILAKDTFQAIKETLEKGKSKQTLKLLKKFEERYGDNLRF